MRPIRSLFILIVIALLAQGFPLPVQADEVEFADPDLEKTIRKELGFPVDMPYPITQNDLQNLYSLTLEGGSVQSLEGLEHATNLWKIKIRNNPNFDLRTLSTLPKLSSLTINNNQIQDLQQLSGLKNLTFLHLSDNEISDLTPLSGLSNLETLVLSNNQIKDLKPLSGLNSLEELLLENNQIKDLSPVAGLTKLRLIHIAGNPFDVKEPNNEETLIAWNKNSVGMDIDFNYPRTIVNEPNDYKPKVVQVVHTFPITYKRATKDPFYSIGANDKGTIMTASKNFLNITRDYGKTWEARKLPGERYYRVTYESGIFYLFKSPYGGSHEIETYYSRDGKEWKPFTLPDEEGLPLTISHVQILNGKRLILATRWKLGKSYIFTSADGMNWVRQGSLPVEYAMLTWNGKLYSAINGGNLYQGKPNKKNQFLIKSDSDLSAELFVATSTDLKQWTKHSGYSGDVKRIIPNYIYALEEERPSAQGTLYLFDLYDYRLTSTDGITFKRTPVQKIFQTTFTRSPIFKKGKTYYVFKTDWYKNSVETMVLTSTDLQKWKETKTDSKLFNMNVFQAGNKFIGTNLHSEIVISDNGVNWKAIK